MIFVAKKGLDTYLYTDMQLFQLQETNRNTLHTNYCD